MTDKEMKDFPKKLPGPEYKMEINWYHSVPMFLGACTLLYGMTIIEKPLYTGIYVYFISLIALFGVNVSAHRLFTHRTFKANAPLRILLIAFQTLNMQRSLYTWVRHHRLHHKYMDTNADPHSSRRGLIFSHIGWLLIKPHPDVEKFGKVIDVSDLEADPYVMFQYRYYGYLVAALTVIVTAIPWLFWGETLQSSLCFAFCAQYAISFNVTWLVNSAAHCFGSKPYDKSLSATDISILSFFATGEGFHNYHHAFPWDYKSAELGNYSLNFSKAFIDFMAWIGWATDLKTASSELVRKRILRTGGLNNNTLRNEDEEDKCEVWGWDDPEMPEEERNLAVILKKSSGNHKIIGKMG